jgi:hypothetical protein
LTKFKRYYYKTTGENMKVGIIGYGSMGKMILGKFIETKTIEESNYTNGDRNPVWDWEIIIRKGNDI